MPRTITVKGIGRVSAKPDYVVLSMVLESGDMDYDKAMELADKQLEQLREALSKAGFDKKALKTADFNVRTKYDNVRDDSGNYHSEFNGYSVFHRLKLEFDLDSERLSKALSAVSGSTSNPELSIAFTVKDASAVNEKLLYAAAQNAAQKAKILCSASGVELGELLSVNYSWSELNILSDTRCQVPRFLRSAPASEASHIDIEPDDIDVRDTAEFVWEIR